MGAVFAAGAVVQCVDVDGVLERAVLDELSLRNMPELTGEAHGEAEPGFGIGVQLGGAELDDVAHACYCVRQVLDKQ